MHKTFNHDARRLREGARESATSRDPALCHFHLGYDEDNGDTLAETLAFAERHKFYIVAFNHLTPFPGTPLYDRLQSEGRLLYEKWWLDPEYRYGMVPFAPRGMTAEQVKQRCIEARQRSTASTDFQTRSRFQSEQQELVHVESFLLDQPAVSRRGVAEERFSLGR